MIRAVRFRMLLGQSNSWSEPREPLQNADQSAMGSCRGSITVKWQVRARLRGMRSGALRTFQC